MNYLFNQSDIAARLIASISPRQQAIIDQALREAMKENPRQVLASESVRAMKADVEIFGSAAFGYEPPSDETE